MLSALVNRTKAFVKIVENYTDNSNKPQLISSHTNSSLPKDNFTNMTNNNEPLNESHMQDSIFDCIRTIRDPEKPATLEDLQVVYEGGVRVTSSQDCRAYIVDIEFNPTVPHCSLATLIGLCMRIKVERNHLEKIKLDIHIKKGAHDTEEEINKQINDKERVAAAMENPNLRDMVEKCIREEE